MSLSFCWTSGPGLEGAEHLEQVQELQKAGCGSAKKRYGTFHGKCVEHGDQMLINQHQLWDFSGCRIRPQMGVTWGNLREMVCRCAPFPSSLGATEFGDIRIRSSSRILLWAMAIGWVSSQIQSLLAASWSCCVLLRRWKVWISFCIFGNQIGSTWPLLYYLYCKADFHIIEGLVLFWHESVMSIAYFQIAEESSNCCNEKDYFPVFFYYPLLSQCNFTSVLLLSWLWRNWDKWSECCSWRTLL